MINLSQIETLTSELNDKIQIIDESLQDLVDDIIKARKKISVNIPMYSTSFEELRVGDKFVVNTQTADMYFLSGATIKAQSINDISITIDYTELVDNSIFKKDDFNKFFDLIKKDFFYEDRQEIVCKYSENVTEFESDEVPSVKYFKDNFLIKDIDSYNQYLFLSRAGDEARTESAVTYDDVINNSAVRLDNKEVDIVIDRYLDLNDFKISSNMISGINEYKNKITLVDYELLQATAFNSVINNKILSNILIDKNLSNIVELDVIEDENNELSLLNKNALFNKLNDLDLQKQHINISKNHNFTYIPYKEVPQTPTSKILAKFYEIDENYIDLIENPDYYIDLLINAGSEKQEPVTLTSINILVALMAHKASNKTIIVTNSEVKEILDKEDELMNSDDRLFKIPVRFKETDNITLQEMTGLFSWQ